MNGFQTIPIAKLEESVLNPRKHFDKKALDELASSIKAHGVLTPILVRPSKGNGHFEIAAGHRRFRAAKAAGVAEIPAMVREMDDTQLLEVLTIENLQREDVHPLEEAAGYRSLMAAGYDVERLAERVGRSVKYVYDRVKLLALTKEAQKLFYDGRITAGHAILLARLSPKDQARAIGTPKHGSGYSGVFTGELVLWNPDDRKEGDREDSYKPVSVRELQGWIDKNVHFDSDAVDPMLFEGTAAVLKEAKEEAEKIVPITHEYYTSPEIKKAEGERVFGPMSWRRASKPCAASITGVIVVGPGRGDAFKVCLDKKGCKVHWAAEQREAKQRQAAREGHAPAVRSDDRYEREQAKREAARKRFQAAAPALLKAIAEKLRVTSCKAGGPIERLLAGSHGSRHESPAFGKDAEGVLRSLAFQDLADNVGRDWDGGREFARMAKPFGVNVEKILAAIPTCRKCGCTEAAACKGGCSWVEKDLCSACAPKAQTSAKKKAAKS